MITKFIIKTAVLSTMMFVLGIKVTTAQPYERQIVKEYLEYATKLTNYDDSTIIRQICLMSLIDEQHAIDSINSLLDHRKIVLNSHINDTIANIMQSMLLYYDSLNDNDIQLYINSPGGSVTAGLGIYDTMQFVNSDIQTICTGVAASMSFVLLSAGTKGKRGSVKLGRFLIHNPDAFIDTSNLYREFVKSEIQKYRNELIEILVNHTGQSSSKIESDMNNNTWMRANEGIDYGIIDYIIE